MATQSNTLAWRIPQTEEPGGLQSMESQSRTQLSDSLTHTHTHTLFSGIPQPGLNVAGNLGITVRRPWETSASSGSRSRKGNSSCSERVWKPSLLFLFFVLFYPSSPVILWGWQQRRQQPWKHRNPHNSEGGETQLCSLKLQFQSQGQTLSFFPHFSSSTTWPQMQHNQGSSGCFPSRRLKRGARKKMRPQTGSSLGK